jgi:cysteinyl-tRNA synthetase
MAAKYLGETIDIHGGGQDLIFPHHEDEIAQSEAANDKPFAKFWLHNGFVNINGEKMSKSLNNFYTLREVFQKYEPLAVRYFFLSTHYRAPINFSFEALLGVKNALERIQQAYFELVDAHKFGNNLIDCANYRFLLEEALDDDLNVSAALAVVFEFVNEIYKNKDKLSEQGVEQALTFFKEIDSILGILKYEHYKIPEEIVYLAQQRELARKNKDWKKSDSLRNKIKELGYSVADSKEGFKIEPI